MRTIAGGFGHRKNEDGTVTSMCERCHLTVGIATLEADLKRAETAHKCDHARMRLFEMTHRMPFQTTWAKPEKPD